MKKIFTILFLITSLHTYAQLNLEWERETPGSNYGDIICDSNNNVLVLVMEGNNMKTLKYSPDGNLLWSSIFVSQYGICVPKKIAVDPKGNVYIAGSQFLFTTVKYDSNGNQQWTRYFTESADSEVMDMTVDTSGNVYITGKGWYYGTKPLTMKYNTSGDLQWARFYHIPEFYGRGRAIALDQSNNVFITGELNQGDIGITLKYDQDGNLIWIREITLSIIRAVGIDSGGNVIVTGSVNNSIYYSSDILICKYSNTGDSLWQRSYSIFGSDTNYSHLIFTLTLDHNNDIYVAGHGGGKTTNFWRSGIVAKVSSNGEMIWSYIFRDSTSNRVTSDFFKGIMDNNDNYYVVGSKVIMPLVPEPYYYSIIANKFNSNGIPLWSINSNSLKNDNRRGISIGLDKINNVVTLEHEFINLKSITKKYSQTVGIINETEVIPESIYLYQNYPNPFNSSTNFQFDLSKGGFVIFEIFDMAGKKVQTLIRKKMEDGIHKFLWNAEKLSSGIYFYKLTFDDKSITKKLILLK